jgi:hypothetical protein
MITLRVAYRQLHALFVLWPILCIRPGCAVCREHLFCAEPRKLREPALILIDFFDDRALKGWWTREAIHLHVGILCHRPIHRERPCLQPNTIQVIADNSQVWLRQFGRNTRRDVADLHRLGVSNNRMREVPSAQVSHITLPQLASTLKVSKRSLPQIMR